MEFKLEKQLFYKISLCMDIINLPFLAINALLLLALPYLWRFKFPTPNSEISVSLMEIAAKDLNIAAKLAENPR